MGLQPQVHNFEKSQRLGRNSYFRTRKFKMEKFDEIYILNFDIYIYIICY